MEGVVPTGMQHEEEDDIEDFSDMEAVEREGLYASGREGRQWAASEYGETEGTGLSRQR
jgi:hypothetical protein